MNYTYPKNYKVKSISEQWEILIKTFKKLNIDIKLEQDISNDGEEIFVIPHWKLIGNTYNEAVKIVMEKISETRKCYDWRNGNWNERYLRQLPVKEKFWSENTGIVVIKAQFGQKYAGKSVNHVRDTIGKKEIPFGIYECLIMLITHPERLQSSDDLWIDCPGDEYSWEADGAFSRVPRLYFDGGRVWFDTYDVSFARDRFGSVSGFLPQSNLETGNVDSFENLDTLPLTLIINGITYVKK